MFEDTVELAENKLLLLYILNELKFPISKNQLTEIVLENNFMNYFILQQYILELISSNFIESVEQDGKHRISITSPGINVLNLFSNRLTDEKKLIIDNYLKLNLNNIKNAISVTADYTIENKNSYVVTLKAIESDITLIEVKLNVVSNKQARDLCTKWKNSSSDLYTKIINLLTQD
ncbi:DUF4364 family protein [Clostridium guangxiense]|uniref:DUF4364 family protein n=1 Tax=Clostridium guangxiense TaxID=1662055 RepID=UPI001E3F2071|nr:DUF4364 family protein [Clostridium guangxiense]MCD2345421.1 DUF4364 family protein [Clostridium guangxiense]